MRPIAMPATGCLIGTPQSIRLSVAPHTLAIELEPFDSRISLTMRIVYGNSSCVGIKARHRALGQRAVTDLAATRAAQRLRLARREGREVVVQHEALPALAGERVDLLLVGRRCRAWS